MSGNSAGQLQKSQSLENLNPAEIMDETILSTYYLHRILQTYLLFRKMSLTCVIYSVAETSWSPYLQHFPHPEIRYK